MIFDKLKTDLQWFCHLVMSLDGDTITVLVDNLRPLLGMVLPDHPRPLGHGVEGVGDDVVDEHHGLQETQHPVPHHTHPDKYFSLILNSFCSVQNMFH